jgi:hypothetical protein
MSETIINPTWPNLVQFTVFSYLSGSDLFHKIALTSKGTRQKVRKAGLLLQMRILTVDQNNILSHAPLIQHSFLYAMSVVNGIQVLLGDEKCLNSQTLELLRYLFAQHALEQPNDKKIIDFVSQSAFNNADN